VRATDIDHLDVQIFGGTSGIQQLTIARDLLRSATT